MGGLRRVGPSSAQNNFQFFSWAEHCRCSQIPPIFQSSHAGKNVTDVCSAEEQKPWLLFRSTGGPG